MIKAYEYFSAIPYSRNRRAAGTADSIADFLRLHNSSPDDAADAYAAVYTDRVRGVGKLLIEQLSQTLTPFVRIFMRRGCSIGVSHRGVLDSGCHVADRAQAEQERGRAEGCSCLGGCVLRDNAFGTG
jgi:hypothetical protein